MTMLLRKSACVFAVAAGMLIISSSAFAQQATPLFAVLNGGNECGTTPPVCQHGDLHGFGSATIIFPSATSICFGIVVGGLGAKPILAHIHSGTSGVNGSIVIPLTPPATGNPGASSGCISPVAAAIISVIRADPTKFYVNVHTTTFSAGAIRGQLQ